MTKTQLKQATLWLWPLFLIALTFCIRIPLIKVRATILPGDEVMFGLMAKHILAGHFPIYYFGQGYLGALEAYVTSSLSLIMGLNGWTVQIGSFLFYSLFMITHFFLIRRLFGLRVSLLSSVLLVMAPVMFWELSVRALGGYTEILFLGSLSFLLWLKVYSDGKRGFLFPLGLSLGLGLWLNPLFFMYLVPLIILTLFWHQGFAERALWLHPIHLLTLKGFKLPPWVKIFLWILHGFILLYLVKQFVVFFTGGWELKILGWDFSRPPFHWKGVRKLFWVLFFEGIGLSLLSVGWTHVLTFLRRNLGWIFGFFLGQLPVILHGVIGREGHRILQGSSAISSDQFLEKLGIIFVKFIPVSVWGISKHTMSLQWYEQAGALFILILFLIAFAFYFFSYRSEWQALTRFRGGIKKEGFFFCLLTVCILLIGFASSLTASRYFAPLYWVSAVMVGFLLEKMLKVSRWLPFLVLALLIGIYSRDVMRYVSNYSHEMDVVGLVDFLEEEKLRGGATSYDNAYRISFYSQERLKFLPLEGHVRIPEYQDFVNKLDRKAIIFYADPEAEAQFIKSHPRIGKVSQKQFKGFKIYVVDEKVRFPL